MNLRDRGKPIDEGDVLIRSSLQTMVAIAPRHSFSEMRRALLQRAAEQQRRRLRRLPAAPYVRVVEPRAPFWVGLGWNTLDHVKIQLTMRLVGNSFSQLW